MPKRKPYLVERPGQIAELASTVRQDIVDTVQALGPSTVRDIALALGKPADALYYHVRRLTKAGLLVVRRGGPLETRSEAVFAVPGSFLKLRYDPGDARKRRMISGIVDGMLRAAGREFRRGFSPVLAVVDGPGRNLWAGRSRAWLSQREMAEANTCVEKLLALMQRSRRRKGSQLVSLTWVLAPVEPRPLRSSQGETGKRKRGPATASRRGA